ncbi:hypothetical protein SAMN05519103_09116 [Rhizobiales bacterium GAS113]|nr:hypothetical protein SAMN05519103_09116 [Rhizobiales bacterium GAS113]
MAQRVHLNRQQRRPRAWAAGKLARKEPPSKGIPEAETPAAGGSDQPPAPSSKRWRRVVAFLSRPIPVLSPLAVLAGLAGAYWAFYPTVTIDPNVSLVSGNPLDAQFTITNSGRVSVFDVVLSCDVDSPQVKHLHIEANLGRSPLGRPIGQWLPKLDPGQPATRDCGQSVGIVGPVYPAQVDVTVKFRWPWPLSGVKGSTTRHFTSRRNSTGRTFIVPNP